MTPEELSKLAEQLRRDERSEVLSIALLRACPALIEAARELHALKSRAGGGRTDEELQLMREWQAGWREIRQLQSEVARLTRERDSAREAGLLDGLMASQHTIREMVSRESGNHFDNGDRDTIESACQRIERLKTARVPPQAARKATRGACVTTSAGSPPVGVGAPFEGGESGGHQSLGLIECRKCGSGIPVGFPLCPDCARAEELSRDDADLLLKIGTVARYCDFPGCSRAVLRGLCAEHAEQCR